MKSGIIHSIPDFLWRFFAVGAGVFAVCGLAGCSAPAPEGDVSIAQSQLVYSGAAAQYAAYCASNGVPLPPIWGGTTAQTTNIGPPGSGKTWTDQGSYTDSFVPGSGAMEFGGHVYFTRPVAPSAPGICVINQHVGAAFSVICQGTNGKACFWEGHQEKDFVPGTPVPVIDNNFGSSDNSPVTMGSGCTSCHIGQNVFITHNSSGHPLNLTAQPSWMPSQPYEAVVSSIDQLNPNPPPETFFGYPASTSLCKNCHSATGPGGQFPTLAQVRGKGYCDVLASVVNKPASKGGMPPSIGECTPDVNCAAQVDPFVAKMLSTCGASQLYAKYTVPDDAYETTHSDANSPVALNTFDAAAYPAFYDHIASSAINGIDVSAFQLSENQYTNNARKGWTNASNPPSSQWPETLQRASMWAKYGTSQFGNLAIASTGTDGQIWEQEVGVTLRNATANVPATALAAGAPSAYVRDDLVNAIVYRGRDSWIHELKWDGTVWNHSVLPNQNVAALSDPVAFNASLTNRVIYKCGKQTICELRAGRDTPDFWKFFQIPTTVPLKGSFMPTSGGNDSSLYYVGTDGLHQLVDTAASSSTTPNYVDIRASADPNIASAPSAYLRTDNAAGVVYLSTSGNVSNVVEASTTSPQGTWEVHTRYSTTGTLLKHDPFARQLMYQFTNSILFRGPNEELFELIDNGGTTWTKSTVYAKPTPQANAFFSCGGPVPAKVFWNPTTVIGNDPSSSPYRDLGSTQDKFCYVNAIKQFDGRVDGSGPGGEEVALAYNSNWLLGGWGNAPSGKSEITANCVRWSDLMYSSSSAPLFQSWNNPTGDGLSSTTAISGGSPATNACMLAGVMGNFSMSQKGDVLLQGLSANKTNPTNLFLTNQTPSVLVECVGTGLENGSPVVSAASRAKTFTWTNNNTGADGRTYAKDTGLSSNNTLCYLTDWANTHTYGCSAGGCGGSQADGAAAWVADGSPVFKTSSGSTIKAGHWVVYGTGGTKSVTASCQSVPFYTPFAVRINCGDNGAFPPFVADTDFTGGAQKTRAVTISLSGVVNPAPADVYKSQHYGSSFSYTIPGFAAGSSHLVRLHFAETNPADNAANKRKFSVAINGTTQISNLDLFATVGLNHAYVKEFTLPANSSGQYVLSFTTTLDAATISGIEVQ